MSIIVIPYTFSAGAVIIAGQHNSNFQTIYSDYNGFIDNTNIATTADIAYSKLNLASSIKNSDINSSNPIVGSNLDLSSPGTIGNTAPNTAAFTTLKVGTTHQGDVLYDNGTSFVRLTPGTSGQVLITKGASANPVWGTAGAGNCLFSFAASCENVGFVSATTLTTAATTNYTYWSLASVGSSAYTTIITSKFTKVAAVSTVTVWVKIWVNGGGSNQATCKVIIGSVNGTVSGTAAQATPEWNSFTVDVSGLSNGTTYDVSIQIANVNNATNSVYLGSVIGIGS